MKTILGIDVGMSGALSFYNKEELLVYDMPFVTIKKNGKNRKRINNKALLEILRAYDTDHAYIELVWAQQSNGVSRAFTYGFGCGQIEMAVASLGIPFTYVSPQKWKKAMQCPKDKNAARKRASVLMPEFAHNWPLKKHDGRAESAMIALYGAKQKGQ